MFRFWTSWVFSHVTVNKKSTFFALFIQIKVKTLSGQDRNWHPSIRQIVFLYILSSKQACPKECCEKVTVTSIIESCSCFVTNYPSNLNQWHNLHKQNVNNFVPNHKLFSIFRFFSHLVISLLKKRFTTLKQNPSLPKVL